MRDKVKDKKADKKPAVAPAPTKTVPTKAVAKPAIVKKAQPAKATQPKTAKVTAPKAVKPAAAVTKQSKPSKTAVAAKPVAAAKSMKPVAGVAPSDEYFNRAPILEFDGISKPIIDAGSLYESKKRIGRCLITYFQDVVDKYDAAGRLQQVFSIRSEGLRPLVYEMRTEGTWGELIYIMVIASGAPSAARAIEAMSAMGVKRFMVCSGAGTINESVTLDKILIPTVALRDEGTSYHYLPAAREVRLGKFVQSKIESVLSRSGEKYTDIKTWTTDAPFRETVNKVAARKKEGCSVVDTECSAIYAVAEHRKLLCGQLMFAGDIVKKDGWDYRAWHAATELREKLFDLSVKCLMAL